MSVRSIDGIGFRGKLGKDARFFSEVLFRGVGLVVTFTDRHRKDFDIWMYEHRAVSESLESWGIAR